jgi:predicted ATP-grasp superfamily ATP-dependent carboligase
MNVFVLDGNENQAVAATRALAAAGHRVFVGSDTAWSKAGWSRDCSIAFRYTTAGADAAQFVDSIRSTVSDAGGGLVLPMTERTTLPLSAARDAVARAGGQLVLPSHETVLRAFDKQRTTEIARSLGIDVPATATIASDEDAVAAVRGTLRYPLVLKPRSSHELRGGIVRTTGGPVYARNPSELERAWARLSRRCSAAVAQEFVAGSGRGYFALMRHGELRAEFAHRRIRDVRPTGSGSAVRESIVPSPRLRAAALAILEALTWHGVAMVEFRVRPDGTPTFLEVNGRFWNSLALAIYAGVNFPAMLATLAERGEVPPVASYRVGLRCRWLLGDLRHLVAVWRGAPAGFPGRFPARLPTLFDVIRPTPGTYHDNFSWRDPLPAVGDWLHFASRTLPRYAGGASAGRVWHAARRPSHS